MMKPGGEYRIFIPSYIGYGDRGAAGMVDAESASALSSALTLALEEVPLPQELNPATITAAAPKAKINFFISSKIW